MWRSRLGAPLRLFVALGFASSASSAAGCGAEVDPYLVEVVSFVSGPGAGFGEEDLVLGPPEGGGEHAGSVDVISFGSGGELVGRLGAAAVDGPGPDLLVFENPFVTAGMQEVTFLELGEVSVSVDGEAWHTFPCAADDEAHAGCAGLRPVYASPDGEIDPRDPAEAGGDAFDLADVGIEEALFVRIRDLSTGAADPGIINKGFDLDAVAAVHVGQDPAPQD